MANNNFKQALHLGMKLAVVLVGACMFAHVGMDFTFSFIFLWKGLSNMKKKGHCPPFFLHFACHNMLDKIPFKQYSNVI